VDGEMSKGSKRRPEDNAKYREGYDAICSATAKVYKSGRRYIPDVFHVKPMEFEQCLNARSPMLGIQELEAGIEAWRANGQADR
jgi:hypothetical protein